MEPLRYRSGAYLAGRTSNVLGDMMEESEFRGPDDFLFHRSDGRPVEPKVFREDILYPAMKRAGILVESRATGLHLFRHTAGSLLNKKTADLAGTGAVGTRRHRHDRRRLHTRGSGDGASKRDGFGVDIFRSLWRVWPILGPQNCK
jgi:hypothetical protein